MQIVQDLFGRLNSSGIRYCHWKSNSRLDQALDGETDLDLLIHRDDKSFFEQTLKEFNFKPVISPPEKQYPGMEDYLGFDFQSGKLIHLHIHYMLVLGQRYVKNYYLPIEDYVLDDLKIYYGVYVPRTETELLLLTIRANMKLSLKSILKYSFRKNSEPYPKNIVDEFEFLLSDYDKEKFRQMLSKTKLPLSEHKLLHFIDMIQRKELNLLNIVRIRSHIFKALSPFRRHNTLDCFLRSLVIRIRHLSITKIFFGNRKKILPGAGKVFAVVGADGAGKSTIVADIRRWLSWKLRVRTFYMGTQKPSWISRCLELPFRITRRLQRLSEDQFGKKNVLTRFIAAFRYPLESVHDVSLATDRYRRYQFGCRAANTGEVVLFDRFPLPEIYDAMDGPRIDPTWGSICRIFADIECRLYQAIARPEHIIALHVSPEISLSRKPSHLFEVVTAKSTALRRLQRRDDPAVTHVNANASLEQVLLQVKRIVWRLL